MTRSSQAQPRRGRAEPTRRLAPASVGSQLEQCLAFNRAGGLNPLEWQVGILADWLGTDEADRWSARTVALSLARQNGKTLGTTEARMNYGACVLNELVLYTSHLQKTSTETFEDMATFFDQKVFRKHLKAIRTALGRESIEFKAGGKVKFLARTRNGGRGQHADLLVFDECQELTDEQQASFMPCLAASQNPQTVYTGTPPDENAPGVVFERLRERAFSGAGHLAWSEWSVDEIGDISNPLRWYETNPSLGILILESTIAAEAADLAPDKFARERLGWWAPKASLVEHVIDAADWMECQTDAPPDGGTMAVGVKFAPDGSRVALAVCLNPEGGKPYVEVVQARSTSQGSKWVAEWIQQRRDRIAVAVIDGKRGESTVQALADGGMPRGSFYVPRSGEVAKANAMLVEAVEAKAIEHYGQPALDASATLTAKRRIGGDGFGFDDTTEGDATLIEACALAFRAAITTKRKPGRKAKVF